MGDFIKDLNAIDFLGMMVPGATMILLFEYIWDPSEEASLLFSFFGQGEAKVGAVGLLVVCGYVVGMLIHELGDTLEEWFWKRMRFNPKFRAAEDVDRDSNGELGERQGLPKEASEIVWKASVKDVLIERVVVLAAILAVVRVIYVALSGIKGEARSVGLAADILAILIGGYYISCKNGFGIFRENKDVKKKKERYQPLINALPQIQTQIEKCGNLRKRTIFDGFHVMMRNLVLVIFLMDVYALAIGKSSPLVRCFSGKGGAVTCMGAIVLCAAEVLMISRYDRFAYLKYKYIFEDYLEYKRNPPDAQQK